MKFADIFPIKITGEDLAGIQDMIKLNYKNLKSSSECIFLQNNRVKLCSCFGNCGNISDTLKKYFLRQNREKEKTSSITFLNSAAFK